MKTFKQFSEAKKIKKSEDDPCWKGYTQLGTKEKNGKEVPNCVPIGEEVEQLDEMMVFDAKDAIKDFNGKGKVAKIKSAQSVTAKVMPVRGNNWDTDNGYVPVLKNFTRKGKMATVELKAGQEVAIDTARGNVYGMVGDKFFFTSTGNVDLTEATHGPEGVGHVEKDYANTFAKKKVRLSKHVDQDMKRAGLEQDESVNEEVAANSVAGGGVDLNPTGYAKNDARKKCSIDAMFKRANGLKIIEKIMKARNCSK